MSYPKNEWTQLQDNAIAVSHKVLLSIKWLPIDLTFELQPLTHRFKDVCVWIGLFIAHI